jgi:translation initiation factor 2 beta subunit (eIF-2beta)/eIF-5
MKSKVFGKSIKLFLIDGKSDSRISCELSNWTGKVYKIPRDDIIKSQDREELKSTGVYFLFGKSDIGLDGTVYIGEAENIYERLKTHLKEKDFWNSALVLISKDDNLNKAHIKYLENRLYTISKQINRYEIKNNSIPTKSSISESDQAEMEEFIANSKILIDVLGYKVLQPKDELNEKKNIYHISSKEAQAKGKLTKDGFLVLKDSIINKNLTNSCPNHIKSLRDRLTTDGTIQDYTFTKDYLFGSASTSSAIILGRSSNGLTAWKLPNKKSLKEVESSTS